MKKTFKLLAFLPLIIQLIIPILMLNKVGGISLGFYIPLISLLCLTGLGMISSKKNIKTIGKVALGILTLFLLIAGYYDFIKYFSSIVGIINLSYFLILGILIKKSNKNTIII